MDWFFFIWGGGGGGFNQAFSQVKQLWADEPAKLTIRLVLFGMQNRTFGPY
jgi:hypothetical protein